MTFMIDVLQLQPEDFGIVEKKFDDFSDIGVPLKDKHAIRLSNSKLIKEKQHKINVCGHIFEVEYYEFSSAYRKNRRKLPIHEHENLDLNHLADNKRFQWLYSVESIPMGFKDGKVRPKMFKVQDFPFAVLDIDGVSYNDMYRLIFIEKKWKFANENHISMCPSTTGRGVHIHVCLDLSNETKTRCSSVPDNQAKTFYTKTYEYRLFKYIQNWLADSFYEDTGIRPDYQAITLDRIAVTPLEIGEINKQWKDKSPIKFSNPALFEKFDEYSPTNTSKYRGRVEAIINQLKSCLTDKNFINEWFDYLRKIGINPGNIKYYQEVIVTIKNNYKNIENHFLNHFDDLKWFRKKQSNIAIPQKDVARMILGIFTKRNETYFRHFILYMFGLSIENNYKFRELTNTYKVSGIDRKYFQDDFLEKYWYVQQPREKCGQFMIPSIEEISSRLGDGRTYEELCRLTKFLTCVFGADKAISWLHDAIDSSSANEKNSRRNFVTKFCLRLERQKGLDNVQDERRASSY